MQPKILMYLYEMTIYYMCPLRIRTILRSIDVSWVERNENVDVAL